MAAPQGVSVAFDDGTLVVNPSWSRIDNPAGYNVVNGWSIDRGRSKELDKTQTGSASVSLIDKNGIVDPTNNGSPFVDRIDPMKQAAIALLNPVTDEWSTIYRGFADWEFTIGPDTGYKAISGTLSMDDAFDLLGILEMTPGDLFGKKTTDISDPLLVQYSGDIQYPDNQQVDDRIKQALLDAGWPASLSTIFSGNIAVQIVTYARRDQLITVVFDAADAEFPGVANVFVSKDGVMTFHGRYARFDPFNPQYGINQWYAGDASACGSDSIYAPINSLTYRRSKQDIINVALALPKGVSVSDAPQNIKIDSVSVGKYGWRSVSFEDLITYRGDEPAGYGGNKNAVNEVAQYAQYYIDNYSTPKTRITQLVFRPKALESSMNPSALWDLMCGVEIGDVITVKTTHPGGGGFNNEDFFVEGIHYQSKPAKRKIHDLTLTLDVSPRAFYVISPFFN